MCRFPGFRGYTRIHTSINTQAQVVHLGCVQYKHIHRGGQEAPNPSWSAPHSRPQACLGYKPRRGAKPKPRVFPGESLPDPRKEEASERGPETPLNPHLVHMRGAPRAHFLPLGVNSTGRGPSQSIPLMPSSGPGPWLSLYISSNTPSITTEQGSFSPCCRFESRGCQGV